MLHLARPVVCKIINVSVWEDAKLLGWKKYQIRTDIDFDKTNCLVWKKEKEKKKIISCCRRFESVRRFIWVQLTKLCHNTFGGIKSMVGMVQRYLENWHDVTVTETLALCETTSTRLAQDSRWENGGISGIYNPHNLSGSSQTRLFGGSKWIKAPKLLRHSL